MITIDKLIYYKVDVVLMVIALGAAFVLEMVGVFGGPRVITITALIKFILPNSRMVLRFMILAFLVWHFLVSDIIKMIQAGMK